MNYDWLTSITMLAVYGGFVSSFRSAVKDKNKSKMLVTLDVLIGMLIATAAADYFVPQESPKLALIVGLIAGSMGGYLMDAIQAIAPNLASGIIESLASKWGYRKVTKDESK